MWIWDKKQRQRGRHSIPKQSYPHWHSGPYFPPCFHWTWTLIFFYRNEILIYLLQGSTTLIQTCLCTQYFFSVHIKESSSALHQQLPTNNLTPYKKVVASIIYSTTTCCCSWVLFLLDLMIGTTENISTLPSVSLALHTKWVAATLMVN